MDKFRLFILATVLSFVIIHAEGTSPATIIADSLTHAPLSGASIFGRNGSFIGTSRPDGSIKCASHADYPITIRYIGYHEKTIAEACADTVWLHENIAELPEVTVTARQHRVLHILAYAREYSTLSSYTDTVTMFREKMVDFMLPQDDKSGFSGWRRPRVLDSRSYYKFSNAQGLDSVSDRCGHHFTWSDWIGIPPSSVIPPLLENATNGTDTLPGKYSPVEIWTRNSDRTAIDIDILADTSAHRWVPGISAFLTNDNIEFEQFKLRLNYDNTTGNRISPLDLTGYSFNIESRGRGHGMFMFNRHDEPFFVTTYTEIYILDKEFISVKEAKKWRKAKFTADEIAIYEPMEAPELHPSVQSLIDRVNRIDTDQIRLATAPDRRLIGRNVAKNNFSIGHRALFMLKQLTGITHYKSHKNFNRNWDTLKDKQVHRPHPQHDTIPATPPRDSAPK